MFFARIDDSRLDEAVAQEFPQIVKATEKIARKGLRGFYFVSLVLKTSLTKQIHLMLGAVAIEIEVRFFALIYQLLVCLDYHVVFKDISSEGVGSQLLFGFDS